MSPYEGRKKTLSNTSVEEFIPCIAKASAVIIAAHTPTYQTTTILTQQGAGAFSLLSFCLLAVYVVA